MKDKKVIIAITIFVLGGFAVINLFISKKKVDENILNTANHEISSTKTATTTEKVKNVKTVQKKVGYETSAQTLQRLGFSSLKDIEKLSDGTKSKDSRVQELKTELAVLDTSKDDTEIRNSSFFIASNLNLLGQTDRAIKQYEYILTKTPDHTTALNNLAWIYKEKGDYIKTEEYFKRRIVAAPPLADSYTNLADIYAAFMKDKKSEIPALIQKGIDNSQDKFGLTAYLAEYYDREGDYPKAIEWYKKALIIKPDSEYIKKALITTESK